MEYEITVKLKVQAPTFELAQDAVDAVLDNGDLQDAVSMWGDDEAHDVTILSAVRS